MGKLATLAKAGTGGTTVVGLTTMQEDSAGFLRMAADMIESGETTPFWIIAIVFLFWALADVLGDVRTWLRQRSKTESEPPISAPQPAPIPPEKTITEHGVLTMGRTGYPEKLTPWEDLKMGKLAPSPAGPPDTPAMRGIPELERCREALVEYMAIDEQVIGSATVAGTAKLYPYLTDLCRILDEQEIPHPEIEYTVLEIRNTGIWSRFLGDLWAERHDIERARRVYLESLLAAHTKGESFPHDGIWELHAALGKLDIPWPEPGITPELRRAIAEEILAAVRDNDLERARTAWSTVEGRP